MTFTAGETVTVTPLQRRNDGSQLGHRGFKIVNRQCSVERQVQSASNPVAAGSTASVTFTVGSAGNYYYICQVDGHVALGMWGNVVVKAAVPEFPAPLLLAFLAVAVTALAAYLGRLKVKHAQPL